ncbi:hypothetical protein AALF16_20400 [Bacillus cereus]|uniref:hypothetical protein n=1 Tax=Bacillus cereus TaxID=1396 RepID=UPI00356C79EF
MGRKNIAKNTKEQFLYERKKQRELMQKITSICQNCEIYKEHLKNKHHKEVANKCAKECNLISSVQEEAKEFIQAIK